MEILEAASPTSNTLGKRWGSDVGPVVRTHRGEYTKMGGAGVYRLINWPWLEAMSAGFCPVSVLCGFIVVK
jgi:hypothetical protein